MFLIVSADFVVVAASLIHGFEARAKRVPSKVTCISAFLAPDLQSLQALSLPC